ncbi:3389_t:CDS:2 [Diversispora eburnea]|uniref:3389_t:CDS:1 n=1 Tax=Diversispora eburnea TaxID=1213867 RepID=A0A9N8VBU2_9GLOM|nr:3389_t:CDS:2 [Diversispora eburnea]
MLKIKILMKNKILNIFRKNKSISNQEILTLSLQEESKISDNLQEESNHQELEIHDNQHQESNRQELETQDNQLRESNKQELEMHDNHQQEQQGGEQQGEQQGEKQQGEKQQGEQQGEKQQGEQQGEKQQERQETTNSLKSYHEETLKQKQKKKREYKQFSYTWVVKDFQNLYADKNVNTHISLYLAPVQSLYERQNNITSRIAKWRFEIYRINNEESGDQMAGLTKLVCHQDVIQEKFTFFSEEPNWGIVKFCDFNTISTNLNSNPMEKVDLVFRVHFLDKNENFSTTDDSIDNLNIDLLLKLGPSLKNYFNNEKFSDVEFTFSDTEEKLRASKIVLASRSKYFNTMFNGYWVESNVNTIYIKDVSYIVFKTIIYFLYTGQIDKNLNFDIFKNVYYEADMREIPELTKIITWINLCKKSMEKFKEYRENEEIIRNWKYAMDR